MQQLHCAYQLTCKNNYSSRPWSRDRDASEGQDQGRLKTNLPHSVALCASSTDNEKFSSSKVSCSEPEQLSDQC